MIQTFKTLTFKEYLTYDDGTDNRYEFDDGRLAKSLILKRDPY